MTATITPAAGAASQQVTVSVNLSPGQARAVQLTGLHLVPSTPTNSRWARSDPNGEPGSAYKSVTVEVPGPSFAGVTTTTTTPQQRTTESRPLRLTS